MASTENSTFEYSKCIWTEESLHFKHHAESVTLRIKTVMCNNKVSECINTFTLLIKTVKLSSTFTLIIILVLYIQYIYSRASLCVIDLCLGSRCVKLSSWFHECASCVCWLYMWSVCCVICSVSRWMRVEQCSGSCSVIMWKLLVCVYKMPAWQV